MEVEKERKEKEEDKLGKEKLRQITEWIKKRLRKKKKNIRKRKEKKLDLLINDIILYNSLSLKTNIGFIINKEFEMRNEH